MEIPDRNSIETVGDMARIILEDERVMRSKNADLRALARIWKDDEQPAASGN